MKSRVVGLHLVIRGRNAPPYTYELTSRITRIGRDATNDVILDHPGVSRKHARLIITHDSETRFIIEDLNSSNGTFVNRRQVQGSAPIQIGDSIMFASDVTITLMDGVFERLDNRVGGTRPFRTPDPAEQMIEDEFPDMADLADIDLQPALELTMVDEQEELETAPITVLEHVFISHADGDNQIADRLAAGLSALDIPVWVDHHALKPSDHWENEIQKALQSSWAGLLVISHSALQSVQCSGERQFFLRSYQRHQKELFVVLVEPFKLDELPYNMSVVQFIDLSSDFRGGLQKLLTAIQEKAPVAAPQPSKGTTTGQYAGASPGGKSSSRKMPHGMPPAGKLPPANTPRVFISQSYDAADQEGINHVRLSLEQANFQVECYEDEPGNVSWRIEVAEAIDRADCVVAVIAPETKQSQWLQHELTYAEAHQKPLFAVHIRGENQTLFGYNMRLQVNLQTGSALYRLIAAIHKQLQLKP